MSSTCGSIGCAHGIASFQSSGVLALEPTLRTRTVTRVRPPADTTGGENSRMTSNFGLRSRTTIAPTITSSRAKPAMTSTSSRPAM